MNRIVAAHRARRRRAVRGRADPGRRRRGRRAARSAPGRVPGVLLGDRASGRGPAGRAVPPAGRREAETLLPSLLVYRDPARRNRGSLARRLRRVAAHGRVCSIWPNLGDRSTEEFEQPGARQRRGARPAATASTASTAGTSRCSPAGCSTSSKDEHGLTRPSAPAAAGGGAAARRRASTSACARITSTRSICSRRRRSSACPTTRRPSSPTSRATTARGLPAAIAPAVRGARSRGPAHRRTSWRRSCASPTRSTPSTCRRCASCGSCDGERDLDAGARRRRAT